MESQRTATNWTLDGIPIEDGFHIADAEEDDAEGVEGESPVLSGLRVAGRAGAQPETTTCPNCGSGQMYVNTGYCPQCETTTSPEKEKESEVHTPLSSAVTWSLMWNDGWILSKSHQGRVSYYEIEEEEFTDAMAVAEHVSGVSASGWDSVGTSKRSGKPYARATIRDDDSNIDIDSFGKGFQTGLEEINAGRFDPADSKFLVVQAEKHGDDWIAGYIAAGEELLP